MTDPDDSTTDGRTDDPNEGDTEPVSDETTADEDGAGERSTGERLAWVAQVGALLVLSLVALVATFRFYFAASEAITVWIADDFVSIFQAAFNLLVLVACAYGVSVLVRRLG